MHVQQGDDVNISIAFQPESVQVRDTQLSLVRAEL